MTKIESAVNARAKVAQIQVLVDAAYAAWLTALFVADPTVDPSSPPEDPEVEWDKPASEAEAALDLEVARLGGELAAARIALVRATNLAQTMTRESMRQAAIDGRTAWRSRHEPGREDRP